MERFEGLPPVVERFAAIADSCVPELLSVSELVQDLVEAVKDEEAMLKWTAKAVGKEEDMKVLHAGDSVILDFGGHRTGYLSFDLIAYKRKIEPSDSPCRLRLIFGEILSDVAEDFEPYNSWLSKAWLPDEILSVDYLPQRVDIPRRHAFRYVKVEILAVSRNFGVRLENCTAKAISSAPIENPPPLSFASSTLSSTEKKQLQKIDEAALLTLRNCMQTVYEDGPRRDMRLWIGDLRLQALTNYSTFGDFALAKRCLYLFAATPFNEFGLLSASCFEKPSICSGGQSIVDFSQIYAAALLDYVEASGDVATGQDLFSVALLQFELSISRVDKETGVYAAKIYDPSGDEKQPEVPPIGGPYWHFIDWQPDLDKRTASHCVIIFGLRSVLRLSQKLGLDMPTIRTPFSSDPLPLDQVLEKLVDGARTHLYDPTIGAFISGDSQQISWASNAWAVMAGVPASPAEAAKALKVAYDDEKSIIGMTPYLHHYLCEAFIIAGLEDYAVKHIIKYWGSMIEAGAETFWEAWDPKRPTFSPYGDYHSNSFCHAWSCTPSLLLRRLGYA